MAEYIEAILRRLSGSKFRSSFTLNTEDLNYIQKNGISRIESHAADFVTKRLAPADPINDGRQTPFKGHPVFKAQHATATCCRNCLAKWHKIPRGRELNTGEIARVKDIIMAWIENEFKRCG